MAWVNPRTEAVEAVECAPGIHGAGDPVNATATVEVLDGPELELPVLPALAATVSKVYVPGWMYSVSRAPDIPFGTSAVGVIRWRSWFLGGVISIFTLM